MTPEADLHFQCLTDPCWAAKEILRLRSKLDKSRSRVATLRTALKSRKGA